MFFTFSNRIFSHFFQTHFQNAFHPHFSHLEKKVKKYKKMEKCVLKLHLDKM